MPQGASESVGKKLASSSVRAASQPALGSEWLALLKDRDNIRGYHEGRMISKLSGHSGTQPDKEEKKRNDDLPRACARISA